MHSHDRNRYYEDFRTIQQMWWRGTELAFGNRGVLNAIEAAVHRRVTPTNSAPAVVGHRWEPGHAVGPVGNSHHARVDRRGAPHRRGRCTTPRRQRGRRRGAARGAGRRWREPSAVQPPRPRRHGPVVAGRHGHGRRHVQQRAEGAGGRALRRARRAAARRRPLRPGRRRPQSSPSRRASRAASASACSCRDRWPRPNGGPPSSAARPRSGRRTTFATPSSRRRGASPSRGTDR